MSSNSNIRWDAWPCPQCGHPLKMKEPKPQIGNDTGFSQVIALHPEGVECPNCTTYWVPALADVQCLWTLAAVQKPQDASLIVMAESVPH
jgi:hypothetical protein